MSRAHLFRPLQDAAGNLQRGATVRILRPGTTTEVSNTLYTAEEGTEAYSQPINCPQGFLSVFLDQPRRVRVGVTPYGGGTEVFFDDIDVARTFQEASEVPLDPIGGLQSLDVQSALAELQTSKAGIDQVSNPQASQVPYDGVSAGLVATDVQGAIDEVVTSLDGTSTGLADHLADTTDAHDASAVSFVPAGTIVATDVQAAMEALDAAISAAGWIYRGEWTVGTEYLANNVVSWKGALYLANDTHTATAPPNQDDNFNRPDGPLGNGWNVENNDAQVDGGRLRIGTGGVARAGIRIIRKNLTTVGADITVTADKTFIYAGIQGIVVGLDPITGRCLIVKWNCYNGPAQGTLVYWDGATEAVLGVYPSVANGGTQTHRFKYDPDTGVAEFWQDGNSKGQIVVPPSQVPGLGTWAGLGSSYWLLFFDDLTMAPVGYAPDATKFDQMSGQTADFPMLINLKADANHTHSDISGHMADTTDAHDASAVSVVPTGTLASTDVQAALEELAVEVAAAGAPTFVLKTANYTLTADDDIAFFNGATLTATVPTPVGIAGKQYVIKNLNATILTVTPAAGTIDGDTSRSLAQYDALTIVSDDTNWGVI